MRVKEESEKAGLKLNIQKAKIMASSPITLFHGKQMENQRKQWQTLFYWLQNHADGDCSHEIKRCLLLGTTAMTNIDSILKNRDIANKVPFSQSYGFSSGHVWMWELDHEES